jgi:hypothetical protein
MSSMLRRPLQHSIIRAAAGIRLISAVVDNVGAVVGHLDQRFSWAHGVSSNLAPW